MQQHAVTHFPPKAPASLGHGGVDSVHPRSADAGKTIVLFVVVSPLLSLRTAPPPIYFFTPLWQCFLGLVHTTSVSFIRARPIYSLAYKNRQIQTSQKYLYLRLCLQRWKLLCDRINNAGKMCNYFSILLPNIGIWHLPQKVHISQALAFKQANSSQHKYLLSFCFCIKFTWNTPSQVFLLSFTVN